MGTNKQNLFCILVCFLFLQANSQIWESLHGYEISSTTPTTPLRVLIVFVEFDEYIDVNGNHHCYPVNDNCWNSA